jgi:glycosyltransferase involved in cell wall biosynthesis
MRIVHLAKYHSPFYGGMESHVETLASKQAKLGADVSIVCVNSFDRNSKLSQRTETEITFKEDRLQVVKVQRMFSFLKIDICPSLIFYILYFSKLSNTIFHVHTPNPTMLIALVLTGKFNNLVVTHHSDVIKQKFIKYLFRPIEHLIYSQAKIVLTTSENYQYGSKFLRLYQNKLGVLPLGLDLSTFANPPQSTIDRSQQLKAQYGDVIWLAVGRLVYYKSFDIALTALQYVTGKLLIVGTGALKDKLQKLAHELNVADRVIWLGETSESDLVAAYHAATALWFPSNVRSEAFGIVQVEAMASGCPVINCQIPGSGVPWVCRDEEEGLTVPVNDPHAFAMAAQRILIEPGLRERLSQGARQRAEKFGDVLMAQRSLSIYQQILPPEHSRQPALVPQRVEFDYLSDLSQ